MELLIRFLATILIVLMVLGAIYITRKKIYLFIVCGLAGLGINNIIIFLIKWFYHPERPYISLNAKPLVIIPPLDSSFPSGHAANAFMIATLVFLFNKKLGILFYILALLVGIGRVLALVHYPIDILGGAILGIGAGFLVNYLIKKILN